MENKKLKINIQFIISAIHIALTFLFERAIFFFSWDNISFKTTIPLNYYIGDKTEMVLTYLISKAFACIIIILLWKLIFEIINKKISLRIMGVFGAIFVIGLLIGLVVYPDLFGMEVDNYENFGMAIRFLPTYWHSIYTGALYAGCMMTIPHPVSIFLFQWLLFIVITAYIYIGINSLNLEKGFKNILFLIFLIPESYELIFNAYRNNYYTLICVFYFSFLFFAYIGKKTIRKATLIEMTILSAFIMVWRSEGVIFGAIGFFLLLVYSNISSYKVVIKLFVIVLVSFALLKGMQDIGGKKYYGKDYFIVSSTNVLYNIFNDPSVKLDETDINKINEVVPAQILKEGGLYTYRNYNYTMGRLDGNQSCATNKAIEDYLSAYRNILINNKMNYLKKQFTNFLYSIDFPFVDKTYSYVGKQTELSVFERTQNLLGREDFNSVCGIKKWTSNNIRKKISGLFININTMWQSFVKEAHINTLYKFLALLSIANVIMRELFDLITKKKCNEYYLLTSIAVLVELIAVIAFMPEGRPYYIYPMLYTSFLIIFFRAIEYRK